MAGNQSEVKERRLFGIYWRDISTRTFFFPEVGGNFDALPKLVGNKLNMN